MQTVLWIAGVVLSAIPIVIAEKRRCKNLKWIYFLSFFLSWTIIGWLVAMSWAIRGEANPAKLAKVPQVKLER